MSLNPTSWKSFLLSDYFDITAGIYHYSEEYDVGYTPYVSASNDENGVGQFIDLVPDFKGNCIVTGKIGCTAFYQKDDFCATSDVNIFSPKNFKLNEQIGLFIVTVINYSENYKWGYGRQCRVGDSKEIVVRLPSTDCGEPDWQFMELYIKSIRSKHITTSFSKTKKIKFEDTQWDYFTFGNLLDEIYKAKSYSKAELTTIEYPSKGYIPYVSRTEKNNGVDCYCLLEDIDITEKGNAIVIGDTTSTISFQQNDFATGDHLVIIRADWLNKYTGLFIVSILQKERFRYSYGRAFLMDSIKKTQIRLPITNGNKPDWIFMENYMKSLPYADKI